MESYVIFTHDCPIASVATLKDVVNPMGMRRDNDVVITSKRRRDIILT